MGALLSHERGRPGSWEQRGPGSPDQGAAERVTHLLPWGARMWCQKGIWGRGEWTTSQMNCLGWRWSSHPHPGEHGWSRHRLYWHNTSHAFRQQQAGGQDGRLRQSVATRVGSWSYPMGYEGWSQMVSFFSNWKCSILMGKEDKEGCTSRIMSATTLCSLKFYLRYLYWDTESSLADTLLGSCH